MDPSSLPGNRSPTADIICSIVESGCLERTTAATSLIPPLEDNRPFLWYGKKPSADGVVLLTVETAKPWVDVVARDPVISLAEVLIEKPCIDSGNRSCCQAEDSQDAVKEHVVLPVDASLEE